MKLFPKFCVKRARESRSGSLAESDVHSCGRRVVIRRDSRKPLQLMAIPSAVKRSVHLVFQVDVDIACVEDCIQEVVHLLIGHELCSLVTEQKGLHLP